MAGVAKQNYQASDGCNSSDFPPSGLSVVKASGAETAAGHTQVSNLIVFIGFCAISTLLFLFLMMVAVIPTLLPTQIVIIICLLLVTSLAVLGFALFSRSVKSQYQAMALFEQQNLIARMAEEISSLRDQQNNLRRAHGEEKLRADAARTSKSAFLAHLSHDIRTPLNHIIGFADLISHQTFGPLGDQRYLAYVKDIKQSGEGLLNGIADVLELSELQSGQTILSREKIIVDEMLRTLKKKFGARAKRCGINLDVDCWCEAVLFGDRAGIERIMANILDNALRFTPGGGQVRIGAWVADDGVVFEVTDTGIGIDKNKLGKLFEPFSLGDASKSRQQTENAAGMGMGLAIARSIAELSGGELAVDSMAGIGTTVAVSLPMNEQNPKENVQAA